MKTSLVAYDAVLIGNLLHASRLGGAFYLFRVAKKRSLFILNTEEPISIIKPTRCTNVANLFHFGMTLYMFRTVFPSIIRSSRLHTATGICMTNACCCMYSLELLVMEGKTVRNT